MAGGAALQAGGGQAICPAQGQEAEALSDEGTLQAANKMPIIPIWRLSKKREDLRDGKEESYERNPGRVPFVFNHKFFETF